MGRTDLSPSEIRISSSEGRQSVLWLGRVGPLEIRKVIQLQTDKLYFTTSVVVKNVGATALKNLYCKLFGVAVVSCLVVATSRRGFRL